MEEVEQNLHHSRESFKDPQDLVSEAKHHANLQEALGCFSGSNPNIQQAPGLELDIVGDDMLQEWFDPCQNTTWFDAMFSEKIKHLFSDS